MFCKYGYEVILVVFIYIFMELIEVVINENSNDNNLFSMVFSFSCFRQWLSFLSMKMYRSLKYIIKCDGYYKCLYVNKLFMNYFRYCYVIRYY